MRWTEKNPSEIALSEAELTAMTSDLDEVHHETLPKMRASIEQWRDELGGGATRGVSRRAFLASSGLLAAGGLALGASGAGASLIPRMAKGASGQASLGKNTAVPLDVTVAALAASLENLAVGTYSAALSAATAGKLGKVPPAIATFVTTAMGQHADHAKAWNAIVYASGYHNVTAPNAVLKPTIDTAFAKVTTIAGVASLALTLEEVAAATYLEAIEVVTGSLAIETAATIHPVEMQHAAILNFVLGKYPVPASFGTLTAAAPAKDAPAVTKR